MNLKGGFTIQFIATVKALGTLDEIALGRPFDHNEVIVVLGMVARGNGCSPVFIIRSVHCATNAKALAFPIALFNAIDVTDVKVAVAFGMTLKETMQ